MKKTIQLTRQELVWQTRCNSWDEDDYKIYLAWLKGFENKEGSWARNHKAIYDVLSAYTWDEIVDMIENDNYDEEPKVQFCDENGEVWYSQCISDVIKEAMREENYDCDVCCEDYADDYDEQWDVMSHDDEEAESSPEAVND